MATKRKTKKSTARQEAADETTSSERLTALAEESTPAIGHNHGYRMTAITDASTTIQRLLTTPAPTPAPTPSPDPDRCRQYVPFLVRMLRLAERNRSLRACLCYYVCRRGRRPRCSFAIIRIVRIVLAILGRCPQYRRSVCRILGC